MSLNKRQFLVLVLFFPLLLNAQVNLLENSPYSSIGIGRIQPFASIRNLGMGGTGLAFGNSQYLNFQNPALLSSTQVVYHTVTANETISSISKTYSITEEELRRVNNLGDEVKEGQKVRIPVRKYTIWETGLNATVRWINSPVDDYANRSLGFQYFLVGIPISQRVYTAVGLTPYSIAGFSNSVEVFEPGSSTRITDRIDGTINQAFISAGVDVTKRLSVGLQTGYLFGRITEDHYLQVKLRPEDFYDIKNSVITANSYSSLLLKPGLSYRHQINKTKGDSAIFFSAGLTADFNTAGYILKDRRFQVRTASDAIFLDTSISRTSIRSDFPTTFGFGVALHRSNNWTVGADIHYGLWSNYNDRDTSTTYTNSIRVSLGGEWKFGGGREAGSIKKPTYRSGVTFQTLPYLIDGSTISDISLSVGASYPIGRINMGDKHQPLTKINVALTVGQQGETSISTGRETYLKGYVGILINDKWFRRRRIQ